MLPFDPIYFDQQESLTSTAPQAELKDAIIDAVEALPPDERQVLEARMWEQVGWMVIARRMGVSRAVVTATYERALENVRLELPY